MTEKAFDAQLWESIRGKVQAPLNRLLTSKTKEGWPVTSQFEIDVLSVLSVADGRLTERQLLQALADMIDSGTSDTNDFPAYFQSARSKELSLAPPKRDWTFFFPFLVTALPMDQPRSVRVLGIDFRFRSWQTAFEMSGTPRLPEYASSLNKRLQVTLPDTCVSAAVIGTTHLDAWNALEPSFDVFRGLLEITRNFGVKSRSTPERPRRTVPVPLWGISLCSDGTMDHLEFYHLLEDRKAPPFTFTSQYFDTLRDNADFTAEPASASFTCSLISDCLRLYSQAMDARFNHECLVGLWQIAEALTLSERHFGDKKVVCTRMAWLARTWPDVDTSNAKRILDWLYCKRNRIVHRGLHDGVTDDDVNFLKTCCEVGISWITARLDTLPTTAHLDRFFGLVDLNERDLTILHDVVGSVREYRTGTL